MKVPTVLIRQTSSALVVLVGLILLAYWPVKKSGFVGFDDNLYVVNNGQVQSGLSWAGVVWAFTTTEAANWHPLTWLSHAADVHFYGLNPEGHHLTNVLIHVLNTLLLYWVLCKATRHSLRSLLVAALFGLHPLNVESVAWVAERKNVLSLFFGLLSLGTYVGYAQKGGWLRYLGSVGFFALGLMAKPMIVTLPCLMLLMDFGHWSGFGPSLPNAIIPKSAPHLEAPLTRRRNTGPTVTAGVQVLAVLATDVGEAPVFLADDPQQRCHRLGAKPLRRSPIHGVLFSTNAVDECLRVLHSLSFQAFLAYGPDRLLPSSREHVTGVASTSGSVSFGGHLSLRYVESSTLSLHLGRLVLVCRVASANGWAGSGWRPGHGGSLCLPADDRHYRLARLEPLRWGAEGRSKFLGYPGLGVDLAVPGDTNSQTVGPLAHESYTLRTHAECFSE
jgi:hypothetical protein